MISYDSNALRAFLKNPSKGVDLVKMMVMEGH